MKLEKDGVVYILDDLFVIQIFRKAGFIEVKPEPAEKEVKPGGGQRVNKSKG